MQVAPILVGSRARNGFSIPTEAIPDTVSDESRCNRHSMDATELSLGVPRHVGLSRGADLWKGAETAADGVLERGAREANLPFDTRLLTTLTVALRRPYS